MSHSRHSFPLLFCGFFLFAAALCFGGPKQEEVKEVPLRIPAPGQLPGGSPSVAVPRPGSGVVDEIRSLTESGIPSSLLRSLELIRSRELGASEFGRIMNAVNAALFQRLYPDMRPQLPTLDIPQTHVYARILRSTTYTPPSSGSNDYLEHVLPFLIFFSEPSSIPAEQFLSALPDLLRAAELNSGSVLAPYFLGMAYERSGRLSEAKAAYGKAFALSPECYPAVLGFARILGREGQTEESVGMLSELVLHYPDNIAIKRQLALAWYQARDWRRAEPAIAEILQRDSRDGEFILMRAHILVEQGQFLQALPSLDLYASVNPNNRLYLFLRARVQAEGYRNRDAALNYLRSLLRNSSENNPADTEALVYTTRLLMESSRIEDQTEGRALLRRLMSVPDRASGVIDLAVQDAVRQENWQEARGYLAELLKSGPSFQTLLLAYTVERGLGNNTAALSYARQLYERDPQNDESITTYISALIDTGRRDEAARMIEASLTSAPGGAIKSRYYYLRSRTRSNEDTIMNDLRSSLFEDPRNLSSLTAMFEVYHRRHDERRAVYYLKQALALAPDNPQLKRYEAEYAAAMGQ
ncbi:hypothetical protein AGMMS49579_19000 [Spirochaetia bacterium]|nr:hypothetical protein AGMMS49579_18950 [Spirochaetia bacterium]GHV55642.1 hypothetical protein AGMMS49579_19000 [Spirochaetia bacterium]